MSEVKQALESRFNYLADKVVEQSERRLWVDIAYPQFREVFDFAVKELRFNAIATITGLDEGENLAFIYHLYKGGLMLNIKTRIAKDKEELQTILNYFPGALIYERELVDLLGVKIAGMPEGIRYPLPDDWPAGQYPLRKDWDPAVLDKKEGNL